MGEHAVRGYYAEAGVHGVLEQGFEARHVGMRINAAPRPAEPDTVDDAGVVERIADHGIFRAEQGLEQPRVGVRNRTCIVWCRLYSETG